jgi:hypothetical protein
LGRRPNLSPFNKYIRSGRVAAPRASIGVARQNRIRAQLIPA